MKLETHINSVCRTCFFHISRIWKIRKFLTQEATQALVQANITSRLDYCNSLYYGLSTSLRDRLQRVQNAAARVIVKAGKQEHITPVLKNLHWLPIEHRISYKIQLLTFKILNGLAPSYLCDLIDQYQPTRVLRSQDQNQLQQCNYKLKAYGGRSFQVAAPKLWNTLPVTIRTSQSLSHFMSSLKTFHFKLAFNC